MNKLTIVEIFAIKVRGGTVEVQFRNRKFASDNGMSQNPIRRKKKVTKLENLKL